MPAESSLLVSAVVRVRVRVRIRVHIRACLHVGWRAQDVIGVSVSVAVRVRVRVAVRDSLPSVPTLSCCPVKYVTIHICCLLWSHAFLHLLHLLLLPFAFRYSAFVAAMHNLQTDLNVYMCTPFCLLPVTKAATNRTSSWSWSWCWGFSNCRLPSHLPHQLPHTFSLSCIGFDQLQTVVNY